VDHVAACAARLTGGRVAVVAAPNHFPMLVSATEFNKVVVEFWAGV